MGHCYYVENLDRFLKALHVLRQDEQVRAKAYSIVKHEWLPPIVLVLTKAAILFVAVVLVDIRRCGTKMGSLPAEDFLTTLDPLF